MCICSTQKFDAYPPSYLAGQSAPLSGNNGWTHRPKSFWAPKRSSRTTFRPTPPRASSTFLSLPLMGLPEADFTQTAQIHQFAPNTLGTTTPYLFSLPLPHGQEYKRSPPPSLSTTCVEVRSTSTPPPFLFTQKTPAPVR